MGKYDEFFDEDIEAERVFFYRNCRFCRNCGVKLKTEEERELGLCEDCLQEATDGCEK